MTLNVRYCQRDDCRWYKERHSPSAACVTDAGAPVFTAEALAAFERALLEEPRAAHQVAVQAIANTAAEPATWGVAGVVELAPGESCENVLPGLERLEGSDWVALPQWRAEAWPPDPALGNFLGAFATVQVPLAGRAVVRLVLVVLGGRAVPLVVSASILPVPALPQRSARSVGRSVADAVVSAAAAAAPRG